MKISVKYAVTGALSGAANGFFGAGGGLFLVPLLISWCGMEQKRAFATSVAVIFPLCAVSAVIYWLKGGLPIAQAVPYLLGGAAGGVLAGKLFGRVKADWLRRAFGVLILYGGIRAVLLRDTGAAISPFNAFLLLQGLETLSLRVERHVSNALRVAAFLDRHPKVKRVNHPSLPGHPDHGRYQRYFPHGGGSIFTILIDGGQEEAHRFIDRLQIFSLLANVADSKSLVIHPASTTHAQLTPQEQAVQEIFPGTIRLSIGTEHIDDLLADLKQALEAV